MKMCPVCKSDKWMTNNSDFSYKCNRCGTVVGKPEVVKKKVSDEDRNKMVKIASDQISKLKNTNDSNYHIEAVSDD